MKTPSKKRPSRGARAKGLFITFEGIEGSGKSTQCHALAQWLRKQGYQVLETREPGGTKLAELLRTCLLNRYQEPVLPWTEALIVLAARSQHVHQLIRPALELGGIVLCDRFVHSTLAYQGYGRGLNRTLLAQLNRSASGLVTPDLTLLFDLPVDAGLQRRHHSQQPVNRIDAETLQFHERVRRGYRALARQNPQRIQIIDASLPAEAVGRQVEQLLSTYLSRRRLAKGPQ